VSTSILILALVGTGFLLAAITRLILPASRRLAWSTTIVAALIGAAMALLPLDVLGYFSETDADLPVRIVAGMIGAVVAVAISTTALLAYRRRRSRGVADASVPDLIAAGEGDRVEFKSTARWNIRTAAKDPKMEEEIAITVAGFMNAAGGTLLIGVDDSGAIRGLDDDYAVVPRGDRDGFEVWLRNLLAERLGRPVTADVGVSFVEIDGKDVCRVDVASADRPVFVSGSGGNRAADFHLRVGNSTRKLLTDEVLEYRTSRWS
jgi:hypothetical protein